MVCSRLFSFVAHDVLQVLVALYIVAANDDGGVVYYFFGQPCLSGYLYGERAARPAYRELEQGAHLAAVVEHRAVGHAPVGVGEVL